MQGSVLYDRLRESCEQGGPGVAGPAMATAHLTSQDRDKQRRPSFLVLCSPSGLPVEALMQQLTAQHPSSVGRVVTHSSRMPLVSAPFTSRLSCHRTNLTGKEAQQHQVVLWSVSCALRSGYRCYPMASGVCQASQLTCVLCFL